MSGRVAIDPGATRRGALKFSDAEALLVAEFVLVSYRASHAAMTRKAKRMKGALAFYGQHMCHYLRFIIN